MSAILSTTAVSVWGALLPRIRTTGFRLPANELHADVLLLEWCCEAAMSIH